MALVITIYLLLDLIILIVSDKVTLLSTMRDGWKDWKKNTDKYQGWRIQNLPPNGDEVYGVCNVNHRSSNSWLRSPFIPREKGINLHINVSFTMRECKSERTYLANCQDVFHLLKYEADYETDEIQYDEKYFVNVDTISSNLKWDNKDRTENILNIHETTTSIRRSGVIIAFKNTGSCVMIKEVVVYYSSCASFVSNFVSFPQSAAGSGTFETNIEGQCVEDSVRMAPPEPMQNFCQPTGIWSQKTYPQMCECAPGYEGNKNKTKCLKCSSNLFKPISGNSECIPCTENSYSPLGSARCYCVSGYYEISNQNKKLKCRKPPPKPHNLRIDAADLARIILTWDTFQNADVDYGETNDSFKYSVACVNCPNKLVISPSAILTGNEVVIHGAMPSREYNFKVTTENYVTPYITNVFDLDQCSTKASILTSPLENIEKILLFKAEIIENFVYVKWQKPKAMSKYIEYECVLLGYKEIITSYNIKNPDVQIHYFGFETEHSFKALKSEIYYYNVKVRWKNTKGWGQFSEIKTIGVKKVPEIRSNVEVTIDPEKTSKTSIKVNSEGTRKNSRKEGIIVIVGAILLVVVLITIVTVVSYCIRRQMLYSAYKMKIKKNIYDGSNPTQMIYSSAYSLPANSIAKYQDPSTYEDISIALQDFTKEVNPTCVTTETLVGEGEFGDVFRGKLKIPMSEEEIVAVKILKPSASQKEKNNFLIEASTIGQFLHENVLRLLGVVSLTDPYMIITDYMVNGSLLNYIKSNKDQMSITQQLKMLSNVAAGMRYLSGMGFVHRDLAARNILLDENLICKIADFGLSRELSCNVIEDIYQNKNEIKIPIKWTAPEAILYQRFSPASDVWSYGVLAWEILSYGDKPYWQWSNKEVIEAIQSGYRLPPPVNCPPIVHNLMLHCWNVKSEQRPTFTQLFFEVDKLISKTNSMAPSSESDYRREYKICEKTNLLRYCDMNQDIIAPPPPPPRNVVFDLQSSRLESTPDAIGFPLTLTRQPLSCHSNPCESDLKMKEPISALSTMNQTLKPFQSHFLANRVYQPCMPHPNHEYRSYGIDFIVSTIPDIPPHKVNNSPSRGSPMTIEEFLLNLNTPQYITLLQQIGIQTVDQLRQLKYDNLKSLGIVSKEDRMTIIKALQPPLYC